MLVGALALAACTAQVADKTQQTDVPAKTAQAARHLHGPVSAVIEAARAHGNLDAAQAAHLDAVAADLQAGRADRHALHQKLKSSVAAVVRSGSADSAEFDRSVSEAVRVFEARVDQSVDAVEEIHAILTPAQRVAVAAALRARIDAHFGPRRANLRERKGFKRVATYLVLSTFQLDKLEAIKKELLGEKKQLRPSRDELLALANAFEGDHFSAALETFRAGKIAILREHVARAGQRTDTVLSVFTPQQRDLLADLIVKGPREVLLGEAAQPRVTVR